MIHHLKGEIEFKGEKFVVIEVAGIGYKVFCSPATLKKLSEGKDYNPPKVSSHSLLRSERAPIKIFTSLYLREDAMELYGFLNSQELGLFETLNNISGIGPKTAMMLASLGSLEKLKEIMEKGQLPPEIKGIGKKRMQKILLELTGKIKELVEPQKTIKTDEALDALISLGFSLKKAKAALSQVSEEIKGPEQRIKEALKILDKG